MDVVFAGWLKTRGFILCCGLLVWVEKREVRKSSTSLYLWEDDRKR